MTRSLVRGGAAAVAAVATLTIAVQFLVVEPVGTAADRAARVAAAREAAVLAELVRHGGAVRGSARVASAASGLPRTGGGIGLVGDGRVVWVPAASTTSAAAMLRGRLFLLAGSAVAAVGGWGLWAGIVRRRGADRAARRRLEIVGMVAHDLRGPLSGITLAADRLAATDLPAAQAAARAAIGRECGRLQVIADDILSVCCDVDEVADRRGEELLTDVLEDVAARVRGAYDHAVVVHAGPDVRHLKAHRGLARAVANAAENAARHSPPGQPVHLRAVADGGAVEVLVEDAGPGFAPDFGIAAFRRGVDGGRAGLGLSSSRRMIERLGGSLGLGARAGGGAAVSLRVPRRDGP